MKNCRNLELTFLQLYEVIFKDINKGIDSNN